VDQLVLEELVRERFPKLGDSFVQYFHYFTISLIDVNNTFHKKIHVFFTVNHLDYLGVQVAWVTGPWFLSIFMNMLPWESGKLCFVLFETFIIFFSK